MYVASESVALNIMDGNVVTVDGQPYTGEILDLYVTQPIAMGILKTPGGTGTSGSIRVYNDHSTLIRSISSDNNGNFPIGKLENGTYYLIGKSSSYDYADTEIIEITVNENTITTVEGQPYNVENPIVFNLREVMQEHADETPDNEDEDTNTGGNNNPGTTPGGTSTPLASVTPTPLPTPTVTQTPDSFKNLTPEKEKKAVQDITSQLEENAKNLTGKKAADTLNNINNITGSIATAIVCSGSTQSQENRETLKKSVNDAMTSIMDASKTLDTDDDLIAICSSLNQIISNTSELIQEEKDSSGDKAISELLSNVVSGMGETINRINDTSAAVEMAKNIISSTSNVINRIDAGASEKSIIDGLKDIMDTVVGKAGKQTLEPVKESDKTTASLQGTQLEELIKQMDTVIQVAEELRENLEVCGIHERLETKVLIDVLSDESEKSLRVELPENLLAAAKSKGIEKIEITAAGTKISVPQDFVENMESQPLALEVKKESITNELLSKMTDEQKQNLDYNSTIYNFNAIAGDNQISNFQKPVCIKIKHELKENENPDQITVLFLADDGTVQNMTGKYDERTGEVIFYTNHFSEYIIKNLAKSFKDVPESFWGIEYINSMASKGIINGVGNDMFLPSDTVTRAEFAKMLTVAANLYNDKATNSFTDVPENKWYYSYVSSAYEAGITNDIYNNEFGPDEKITRQEMATMIANAMPVNAITDEETEKILGRFKDSALLGKYARKGMALAIKAEIIFGKPGDLLDPMGLATRAEAAAMIYRYFNY